MQTTDCKQGTKCSVHSTDMLGTKSLDCDKNSWKQILVRNCEDAGFIFYFGKIKVNKCHATNKKQKGIDTVSATWFLVLCCMFYIDFSPVFSCFLFIIIIITYLTRANPSAEAVIVGFQMTSLKFKLQNYRSYWDFTFMVY